MKPMGVSQSDMDTNMKSNFSDMRSDISHIGPHIGVSRLQCNSLHNSRVVGEVWT
jgi:hypothetical protein